MVIWPEFRIREHKYDDHREDASHLIVLYEVCIFNSNLPFLKFFLPFSVFVLLLDKVTVCDSDGMRTAAYNHLTSRNYNINYFRLPDSAKSKTTISYWLVCPTNWSTLVLHGGIFPLYEPFLNLSRPQFAACNKLSVNKLSMNKLSVKFLSFFFHFIKMNL